MIATASAVAFVVFSSCKEQLQEAEEINIAETPVQTVDSMFVVQTDNGRLKMRIEAGIMERYDNDTSAYELFPKGLSVFAYSEDGELEPCCSRTMQGISRVRCVLRRCGRPSAMSSSRTC